MLPFWKSTALMLSLLNPFLVIVYLSEILGVLSVRAFSRVLIRAGVISLLVFSLFAIAGDRLFSTVFQAQFASFQIFGGIVILFIGLQLILRGGQGLDMLRGESEHLSGAIAMPFLIGPGTVSASVLVGERLEPILALLAISTATVASIAVMVLLKALHDFIWPRREELVKRYVEVMGRVTALYAGTVGIEMILLGLYAWRCPHQPGMIN